MDKNQDWRMKIIHEPLTLKQYKDIRIYILSLLNVYNTLISLEWD